MTTEEFTYDEGDPLAVQDWTVPAEVTLLELWVHGGGTWWGGSYDVEPAQAYAPWWGLWLQQVPVTPGDVLGILLGGASHETTGGTNGGGAGGGGYSPPNGWRGYGGGGATEITRNGAPWIVAGGAAGAVEGGLDNFSDLFTTGDAVPGASVPPRLPRPQPSYPDNPTVAFFAPGSTGGVHDGAAGINNGDMVGSGGGGGGWGGGASGGIMVLHWSEPYDDIEDETVGLVGRFGGSLVPGGASVLQWDPSTSAFGSGPLGHGWVRIDYVPGARGPWSVGRLRG